MFGWSVRKTFVIGICIITIICMGFIFKSLKSGLYLRILPSETILGKVDSISIDSDVDGKYLTYHLIYKAQNKNYSTTALIRPDRDYFKLKKGDIVEIVVSKINPNIAMYSKSEELFVSMIGLIFIAFFNYYNIYIIHKHFKNGGMWRDL